MADGWLYLGLVCIRPLMIIIVLVSVIININEDILFPSLHSDSEDKDLLLNRGLLLAALTRTWQLAGGSWR